MRIKTAGGLPWWSSGYDSVLQLQGALVRSLVEELRFPHALQCSQNKTTTKIKTKLYEEKPVNAVVIVFVQSLSLVWLFVTPWTAACQASLSFTISWSLLKLMSIESVMPSNHLILCHPFFLLPSIFPSIRVFSNESVLRIRWPRYWSFSFSPSPSNAHSGLISFGMDWLDLFAVQGTLESSPTSQLL